MVDADVRRDDAVRTRGSFAQFPRDQPANLLATQMPSVNVLPDREASLFIFGKPRANYGRGRFVTLKLAPGQISIMAVQNRAILVDIDGGDDAAARDVRLQRLELSGFHF